VNIQLPLTSDEFVAKLKDLGLIARDAFVTEVSIYARYGEPVMLQTNSVVNVSLPEALK
jgi:hypothetical protein